MGSTLFIIFITDIDEGIANEILKFADDIKILKKVSCSKEALTVQDDLSRLYELSQDWQMLFNASMCNVMHIGYNSMRFDYFIDKDPMSDADEKKDLVVWNNDSPTSSTHCSRVIKLANRVLGIIQRTYEDIKAKRILQTYIIQW